MSSSFSQRKQILPFSVQTIFLSVNSVENSAQIFPYSPNFHSLKNVIAVDPTYLRVSFLDNTLKDLYVVKKVFLQPRFMEGSSQRRVSGFFCGLEDPSHQRKYF